MGRKKKSAPESSGPPGAPEWIVTFTDMTSLLVTFFVLLMTFSSVENFDRLRVDGWLTGTRGALRQVGGQLAYEAPDEDIIATSDIRRGALQPHVRPSDSLLQNLAEMGQTKTSDDLEIDLNDVSDGVRFVFGDDCAFEPGTARVNASLERSLRELAVLLEHYPHMVLVEGFTDAAFKPTAAYRSAEELSMARAVAAVQTMLAASELAPERVLAAAIGSARPRGDDATSAGRLTNRRVEAVILSLSKARADHLSSAAVREAR